MQLRSNDYIVILVVLYLPIYSFIYQTHFIYFDKIRHRPGPRSKKNLTTNQNLFILVLICMIVLNSYLVKKSEVVKNTI